MSLSIGIVGLPNVGKSTLFQALTNKQVDIQNYPFTTIDPSVGVVAVPDKRVDKLAELSHSQKKIYATVEFTDIAGLVKGAAQGEGLGNKFLANIRETDAIAHIVRVFTDANVSHVHSAIDPANDIGVINAELILADLETVTKRLEKTQREAKSGDKKAHSNLESLETFKKHLESENLIANLALTDDGQELAKELNLLTAKKFIYVFNVSEQQLTSGWPRSRTSEAASGDDDIPSEVSLQGWHPDEKLVATMAGAPYVVMCNKLELTLSTASPDEKKEYLTEFGLPESGLDALIKTGYSTLGLLTFLTTGEDETRAWTAHIGDPIPRASRAIHTDFETKFIRADVINWKTLLESGGWSHAREKGLLKTVGRDYIIQEGDTIEIKISN